MLKDIARCRCRGLILRIKRFTTPRGVGYLVVWTDVTKEFMVMVPKNQFITLAHDLRPVNTWDRYDALYDVEDADRVAKYLMGKEAIIDWRVKRTHENAITYMGYLDGVNHG